MVLEDVLTLTYFENVVDEVGGIVRRDKSVFDVFADVAQKSGSLQLQNGQFREFTKYEITVRSSEIGFFHVAQKIVFFGQELRIQEMPRPTRSEFTTFTALKA